MHINHQQQKTYLWFPIFELVGKEGERITMGCGEMLMTEMPIVLTVVIVSWAYTYQNPLSYAH